MSCGWVGPTVNLAGHCEKEKNFLPLLGTEPKFFGCPVLRLVTLLTMLYWIQLIMMLITEEVVQK
jgi:hypothetical protein